jgi:hypothetical protein
MKMSKRSITCFCEHVFETEIPESVDLVAEPSVADEVLRGDFMTVSCPLCGKRLSPEYPCAFTGVAGSRRLFFIPELDRVSYLRGKLPYETGNPWRVAIGFPELAEKLKLAGTGMDDRVIEIMKYYLLTRSSGQEGMASTEDGEGEVTALFAGEEHGKLLFHISGLRKGEIAVAKLGRDLYSKIESDIEKRVLDDPFKEFCDGPYVSVRRIA